MISPSATSTTLSDGKAYPYFLRTIPTAALSVYAGVDVTLNLLNYTSVAVVASEQYYGLLGGSVAINQLPSMGLEVSAIATFPEQTTDFTLALATLQSSRARIIFLSCAASDASSFMRAAFDIGIGGDGFLWLYDHSAVADAIYWMDVSSAQRERILKGCVAVEASGGRGGAEYEALTARRRQLPLMSLDGVCSAERDVMGAPLWAQDHDDNESTVPVCAGDDPQVESQYDPFAYDAVFAFAYALHDLIEVRNRTNVEGSELLETLIKRVHFDGVTGVVRFADASADPDRTGHGDRGEGVLFSVFNYQGIERGLVNVGTWRQCSNGNLCQWSERWQPQVGEKLVFSTADNSRPPQVAPIKVTDVRVGMLLPMFGTEAAGFRSISSALRAGVYHALREINNKSDG
eukprot:6910435-Prymnesium_polylepis.1